VKKPLRNRGWRKLHLAVDADTGEIVASGLTARRAHDCTQVPALLEQIDDPVASVSADGACDTRQFTKPLMSGVKDERREWHTCSGYSKRRMVENTMYRYKTIIGRSMRSRTFAGQRAEARLASGILNTMTSFGMPDSYRVA